MSAKRPQDQRRADPARPFQIRQQVAPTAKQAGADPAAPPFATRDGAPRGQGVGGGGNDFAKNPTGNGDATPPRNVMADRSQPQPSGTYAPPADVMARTNVAQGQPRSALERVAPASVAGDGGTHLPPQSIPASRVGTGDSHRPFKLKGG